MIEFQPADAISEGIFMFFAVIMMFVVFTSFRVAKRGRKWQIGFGILLVVFAQVAMSGAIRTVFWPMGPILMLSLIVYAVALSRSQAGREMAAYYSLATLIGFQAFRLPLELILHHWVTLGTVPWTMTWNGQNWDIVTGIISLASIRFVNKYRWLAMAVNILGFLLLLNVLRVVMMSSPVPGGWLLERPLMLIAYYPYAWIGPCFVMPALAAHLLVFKKLRMPS